jgi:hypothetical protein
MSLRSAFGQWDATAHHQLFLLDMASWMPAQGASGVGGGRDIHHGSMWRQMPYDGTTLYCMEQAALMVPPPSPLFSNRLGCFTDWSNHNPTCFNSGIAVQPHPGFCTRAQCTIPEVTLPMHRFSSPPNVPRIRRATINNVSIDLIKLDCFETMIQDIIEASDKQVSDQPTNRKGFQGTKVTEPKLRVCLVCLLHEFCQMRKPASHTARGVARKANTRRQAFCFSAILVNPDLGKPEGEQAPVPATQTTGGTLGQAQLTNQPPIIVTPATRSSTRGIQPNRRATTPQWGY